MLLQHSRRDARLQDGVMVPLEDQDRARWDRASIDEGRRIVQEALAEKEPGPYQLQAAIAALHAEAGRPEDTDWPQIVLLYRELLRRHPSPVVELNLAVALSNLRGPEDALERIDALAGLDDYQPFHAARAEMLRRLGRVDDARAAYERALRLTENEPVRRFLQKRASLPAPPPA